MQVTKKRQCIKNAITKRCRKSLKKNNTSKNCKYFKNTSRCRKTIPVTEKRQYIKSANTKRRRNPLKTDDSPQNNNYFSDTSKTKKTIPVIEKRQCIKNATTNRCRKSLKKDDTSKNCNYFRDTSRCRKIKKNEFIEFTILGNDYQISSYVLKWLNALKKSNKIPKNFENHPEELNDLLKGLEINGEKDMKDKIMNEILNMAKYAAIDDLDAVDDIIQIKHVRLVLKMNRDISYAVNGKYVE